MSESEKRMHEIQMFDSIAHRHDTYRRELERLACECEDLLPLLDDQKPEGVKWVASKLREALERIYIAGQNPARKQKR